MSPVWKEDPCGLSEYQYWMTSWSQSRSPRLYCESASRKRGLHLVHISKVTSLQDYNATDPVTGSASVLANMKWRLEPHRIGKKCSDLEHNHMDRNFQPIWTRQVVGNCKSMRIGCTWSCIRQYCIAEVNSKRIVCVTLRCQQSRQPQRSSRRATLIDHWRHCLMSVGTVQALVGVGAKIGHRILCLQQDSHTPLLG